MAPVVEGHHVDFCEDDILIQGDHDVWLGRPGEAVGPLDGCIAQLV